MVRVGVGLGGVNREAVGLGGGGESVTMVEGWVGGEGAGGGLSEGASRVQEVMCVGRPEGGRDVRGVIRGVWGGFAFGKGMIEGERGGWKAECRREMS